MKMNDKGWTVYMHDSLGYPKIVKENVSEWESWHEMDLLRRAGATRVWREDGRTL